MLRKCENVYYPDRRKGFEGLFYDFVRSLLNWDVKIGRFVARSNLI